MGVASASAHGLITGFDDGLYQSPNAKTRARWFDRTRQANAGMIRLNVVWRSIAPTRPANPGNPGDPAYNFGSLDPAVVDATSHGLKVMLNISTAPDWAEGKNRPAGVFPGSWKPSAKAFGDFAHAVAARYSGRYAGLPRVRSYEAWNEPNLLFLEPQWRHGNKPASPSIYRRLLNAFYAGVKQAQPGAVVIGGATGPYGAPPGTGVMRPAVFLRNLFCLNARLKPTCRNRAHLDAVSHHPIVSPLAHGGPHHISPEHVPLNPNDIEISNFGEVRQILRAAERAKRVRPGGHHAIWATEFWWFSDPPNHQYGLPLGKQARYIEQTLYLAWKQGASVAVNLEIRDSPYNHQSPFENLQTGVFFHNGKRKPSFRAFRFPFVTHHGGKHKVGIWGKAPRSGKLKIQRRRKGEWRTVKSLHVKGGKVFTTSVRAPRSAKLRGRVGGTASLPYSQRLSASAGRVRRSAKSPSQVPRSLAPYIERVP